MKITGTITTIVLLLLGVVFFVGCEEEEEAEEVNPLVGTWDMSNMEQSSTYYADTDDYAAYGITDGMVLGQGAMTWTEFSDLGVSATVDLKDDFTFTLSGYLPVSSDTLGYDPTIVPLNDLGTWEAAADLSTLIIDGGTYDLGGALTLDDQDDPTVISMYYTETDAPDTVVVIIDADQDGTPETPLPDFPITEDSETTLGWTKQ